MLKPDVCIISDRHIFAPRRNTNITSPLSEPYKFLLHILKNNSAAENCTDMRLGQVVNLSIFDSIISEILGLRHSTVLILVFDGVTLKTTNTVTWQPFQRRVPYVVRELKQLRRRPQRQFQKTIGLMIKTTALHVHHSLSSLLWRPLLDYDVKAPNSVWHFMDDVDIRRRIFLPLFEPE